MKNFGALSPGETQSTGFQKLIIFEENFMEKYPLGVISYEEHVGNVILQL
jgi:hypothetical protein